MAGKLICLFAVLALLAVGGAARAQIRVSPNGQPPPDGNGRSWDHALPAADLQKLVDGGGEIWLAPRGYPSVNLRKGTVIEGGYRGSPAYPQDDTRDPAAYKTYLNGVRLNYYWRMPDNGIVDLASFADGGTLEMPGDANRVDGCTIFRDSFFLSGVTCLGTAGRPTIKNCVIQGVGVASADFQDVDIRGTSVQTKLGGEYVPVPSSLRLEDCEVRDWGVAGLLTDGQADVEVVRTRFFQNRMGVVARLNGEQRPKLSLSDCVIEHNGETANDDSAYSYRGLYFGGAWLWGAEARIERCRFTQNVGFSLNAAGGLAILLNGANARAVVKDCTFSQNIGKSGAPGGLLLHGGGMTLDGCTISGNRANVSGGGGVVVTTANFWGGVAPPPVLRNCLISGNTAADSGGAVFLRYADPRLQNCTIVGNAASQGGGVYTYSVATQPNTPPPPESTPDRVARFTNCALFGNTATTGGSAFWVDRFVRSVVSGGAVVDRPQSLPEFLRCAYGTADTWWQQSQSFNELPTGLLPAPTTDGSFATAAPGFVNPAASDFHLTRTSLLADRGDDSLVPFAMTTDGDGKARIVGSAVDIGAYERLASPPNVVISAAAGKNGDPIQIDARLGNLGGQPAPKCVVTGVVAVDAKGKAYPVKSFSYALTTPAGDLPSDGGATTAQLRVLLSPNGNATGFVRLTVTGGFTGGKFTLNRYITLK